MGMPNNLVLIRHGESEGNIAVNASKRGDNTYYNGKFMTTPGHQWRLTDLGRRQAQVIGKWVNNEIGVFDHFYVSPYVRTRETAAHMDLPNAAWLMNRALRERDWGDIGSITRAQFAANYPDNFAQRQIDPLYWCPPNGESIAHVAENRVRNVLSTLHRECSGKNVIAVTHGELMWAFRLVMEYWSDDEFVSKDALKSEKIGNCAAIHYTRLDPTSESRVFPRLSTRMGWVRKAVPVVNEDGTARVEVSDWKHIEKPVFTNADLLDSVETVEPLF